MTAQFKDSILFEGKMRSLTNIIDCPDHLLAMAPNSAGEVNTGNWKGYLATWEIKEGKLFLNEISGSKRASQKLPVPAEWYSGLVAIATGDFLENLNDLYSIYESEVHIEVQNGVVGAKHEIKNSLPDNLDTSCKYCRLLLFYQGKIDD